jgi:hypothetical protein
LVERSFFNEKQVRMCKVRAPIKRMNPREMKFAQRLLKPAPSWAIELPGEKLAIAR